ncbi:MAG: circadian clock KaiB family protein, partial [Cyanobacteriota bacterium]|nr:circadian clock KaiB family protein [Cyanobacteriota bacterium]
MGAASDPLERGQIQLKLLLFIDKRPSLAQQVQRIRQYLKGFANQSPFHLDVVDIGEQPYLAEHYKLVASPALIKIAPLPQQMLAGSDIVSQLEYWWPKWQQESLDHGNSWLDDQVSQPPQSPSQLTRNTLVHSTELIRLSDEIFRINQAREELEAQVRFKDRIIAMMAHDLRNPLTAASIAIETLELGYAPDQSRHLNLSPELTGQLLKHAKTQIQTINRMITDILKTARGASVELQLHPQELDLVTLCCDVANGFKDQLQAKQQRLSQEI